MLRKKKKLRYAHATNKIIEAMVNHLYRFETPEEAGEWLMALRDRFIFAKEQEENPPLPSVKLWVKGLGVSEEELNEGFLGHYAIIRVCQLPDGHYTLYLEKEEKPLHNHPQRKLKKMRHPNWAHPLLRQINKGTRYPTIEAAQAVLDELMVDYPDVAVPGKNNRLYIMVYSRNAQSEGKPPIQRVVLQIHVDQDGQFHITCEENTTPPKSERPQQKEAPIPGKKAEENDEHAPTGYFTSMVKLKRNK